MSEKNICSIEECDNKHYSRGYCRKHYERLRRHGNPYWTEKKREVFEKCQSKDCDRAHFAKGFCVKHYTRLRKNGHHKRIFKQQPDRYKGVKCKIYNCQNVNLVYGYCSKHYQRFLKFGFPE